MIIDKGDKVFTPTKRLGSNLPTYITVYQLEGMICSFCTRVLKGQLVTLSFDTRFAKGRLLFKVKIQLTDHLILCHHLHSLHSQVAKSTMPKCFVGTSAICTRISMLNTAFLIEIVETSFSSSRGHKLGLRVSDFTS